MLFRSGFSHFSPLWPALSIPPLRAKAVQNFRSASRLPPVLPLCHPAKPAYTGNRSKARLPTAPARRPGRRAAGSAGLGPEEKAAARRSRRLSAPGPAIAGFLEYPAPIRPERPAVRRIRPADSRRFAALFPFGKEKRSKSTPNPVFAGRRNPAIPWRSE